MTKNCQYMAEDGGSIECEFESDVAFQKMFSLPLGSFTDHVLAHFTIGVDPKYGNDESMNSTFFALLSDGNLHVGFLIYNRVLYDHDEPLVLCNGIADVSSISCSRLKPLISRSNSYPSTYDIIISTNQKSAICTTAFSEEGSYTTSGYFDVNLKVGNQLTLDFYQYTANTIESKYSFRYILVDIQPGL